ncbi:hypothetical protein GOBAR_DD14655 [Gossypium barbadense]|nr:hypothetical protein GOBAR_DD14655 [Gossypium barbadense]
MANKLISEIPLPKSIANVFSARNDALSLTEFELMELLDVGLTEVRSALSQISEIVAPPYQTLYVGIPFGVLTELVGPAGIGKTQFCLKLSLLASLPTNYGGLDGRVIYIDVESKFSSRRLLEIGLKSFPEIFQMKEMAQEMAGRILVLRPTSLAEFTQSLEQIKVSLLQNQVKMIVIDSMAALVSGEHEQGARRQQTLSWHISFIKSLAEFSRIPVVVTNQVRSRNHDDASRYCFQISLLSDDGKEVMGPEINAIHYQDEASLPFPFNFVNPARSTQKQSRDGAIETPMQYDSHLVAALGIQWAHAVTTRLVLEAKSGCYNTLLLDPPLVTCFSSAC